MSYVTPDQNAVLIDFLKEYAIIPIGLFALFFYGRFHFNTPDYVLTTPSRENLSGLTRDMPMSKLRGLAPPIFTTSRARYRRYANLYVLILELCFLLAFVAPELIGYAIGLITRGKAAAPFQLPDDFGQRGILALFVLTGLLSSFPLFKDIDSWLLAKLHRGAVIPDGAEVTAEILFDASFKPNQDSADEILRLMRSPLVRSVALDQRFGSLEKQWFHLRCMTLAIKRLLFHDRNFMVLRILRNDLAEIEFLIEQLRERIRDYFEEQDRTVPSTVSDIDLFFEAADDSSAMQLRIKRQAYEGEVQALRFRVCRLCALAIFASETKTETMNTSLKNLGFKIDIFEGPGWNWESIATVAFSVAGIIAVLSWIYGYFAIYMVDPLPAALKAYIPREPSDLLMWVTMGTFIHIAAVLIALIIKRYYARSYVEGRSTESSEAVIVGFICYFVMVCIEFAFLFISHLPKWHSLLWAVLPTITAIYVSKYVDKSRSGKAISNLRTFKQGAVMATASAFISLFALAQNLNISGLPTVVLTFIGYATIISGVIGVIIGQIFQRTYSHGASPPNAAIASSLPNQVNARVVGDLVINRSVVADASTQDSNA